MPFPPKRVGKKKLLQGNYDHLDIKGVNLWYCVKCDFLKLGSHNLGNTCYHSEHATSVQRLPHVETELS